ILLLGVALLTPQALGGVAIYVMGHAMIKGGLFLAAGIVLHRTATLDEIDLWARQRRLPGVALLLIAGAAGLAGLPPFGTFWGEMMIGGAAQERGAEWIEAVAFIVAAVTAAAVLRFTARGLFGWGVPPRGSAQPGAKIEERPDTFGGHSHTPAAMSIPAAAL